MSATPDTAKASVSPGAELELLERDVRQLRRRLQRNNVLTVVVAVALLALLVGYFYYASLLWAEVTQPERLVDLADAKIKDTLPELRGSLEKRVTEAAPGWAEGLSKQAIDSVPAARKRFETFVLDQLDTSVKHARLVGTNEFRSFVAKHRSAFDEHIEQLANDAKAAEKSLELLIAELETEQDVNLKVDMGELLKTLKGVNEHWRYLLIGRDLDEEARLERRVWMLARRLQMGIDDSGLGAGQTRAPADSKLTLKQSPKKK